MRTSAFSVHSYFGRYLILLFITLLMILTGCNEKDTEVVEIGALFSITGNWSTLGITSRAAMQIALEDVNDFFTDSNEKVIFTDFIADTELIPENALQYLQEFHNNRGIRYVIGPMSSAEVAFIKHYADENDLFILSQGSTAGSLSIADDNIFRLAPDDMLEGIAVVALLENDGIEHIVPVWRNDEGNIGLADSTSSTFTAIGGSVSAGTFYEPDTTDFSDTVSSLEEKVAAAVDIHGNDSVAVYLAGFDEVTGLFALAKQSDILSSVTWYGSNGVVFSEALLNNTEGASGFAENVIYPCPIFGIDPDLEDRWGPVAKKITERTGIQPDAFALSVYDAVWLIALSYFNADDPDNIGSFKDTFTAEASVYEGITGSTKLNEAGDRKTANFDFWGVRNVDGEFMWEILAFYNYETGNITEF